MGGVEGLSGTLGSRCGECGQDLPAGRRAWCTDDCQKAGARRKRLWEIFRITPEEYDAILEFQGGTCAICGKPPKAGKHLHVDHSHKTGHVRGLLDFACNRMLIARLTDDAILKIAEYVTVPPARSALGRDVVAPGRPPKKRRPRKRRTARTHPAARVSL